VAAATANTTAYPYGTYLPTTNQYAATAQPLQTAPPTAVPAYYPQPSSVAAAVTYSAIDSSYQARPTYTQSAHANIAAMAARPAVAATTTRPVSYTTGAAAYTYAASTSSSSYCYPTTQLQSSVTAAAKPNIYVQPQQATTINLTPVPVAGPPKLGQPWRPAKPATAGGQLAQAVATRVFKGPRIPPKPQQLHYCEVCKISCAGPQTYKEHLEGQKHKKKEASMKTGTGGPTTRGGNALRCELCDVTCTGSDAYAAHIRGAKHQKVVKLHTKLGKPIPSVDPVLVTKGTTSTTATTTATTPQTITNIAKPPAYTGPRQPAIPKITFVGSDQAKQQQEAPAVKVEKTQPQPNKNYYAEQEVTIPRLPEEKDVQPVGHDYIEEIKNDEGKVVSFNCKLCECRFNDPNAKEMHMKGRRHRLQFKKKVNPDLVVDIKPSLRQRKMQEERAKRSQAKEEFWKRREEEFRAMEEEERVYWDERRRFEEEMDYFDWYRRFPGRGPVPGGPGGRFGPPGGPGGPFPPFPMMRRPDTVDDRHCMAKHTLIYPSEEDLAEIQKIVSHCEKGLKLVSDHLAAQDSGTVDKKQKVKKEDVKDVHGGGEPHVRVLKGVMRVGALAKGLLLVGDNSVRLVVLVGEKPTKSLLERIVNNLPCQLAIVAPDDSYEVKRIIEDASLVVSTPESSNPRLTVTITLTSPLMRETEEETVNQTNRDPPDVLDHDKCLLALAELRHAKWFQARAAGRQSCVIVIRILRDLCQRVPTWSPLKSWALELLVEKVLSSAGVPLSPGDALRRVFESLAGGILLPDSPGFLDPCEKEPTDAAFELTNQEREDITASAQHALRLIAFRQVHKVLGIDPLPPPKQWRFARKRRRDSSTADGGEADQVEAGKKDKKDLNDDK